MDKMYFIFEEKEKGFMATFIWDIAWAIVDAILFTVSLIVISTDEFGKA